MKKYIKGTEPDLQAQLELFAQVGRQLVKDYRPDLDIVTDENGVEYGFRKVGTSHPEIVTHFVDKIYEDSVEGKYVHHPENFTTWEPLYIQAMVAAINPDLEIKSFELTPEEEI